MWLQETDFNAILISSNINLRDSILGKQIKATNFNNMHSIIAYKKFLTKKYTFSKGHITCHGNIAIETNKINLLLAWCPTKLEKSDNTFVRDNPCLVSG